MTSGAHPLRHLAPAAAAAPCAVEAALWSDAADAGLTGIVATCGVRTAGLLGVDPLPCPPHGPGPWTADDGAVVTFAEQTCLDVAAVSDGQRTAFVAAAGKHAGTLAAALWVTEFLPRTRHALDALFGPGSWPAAPTVPPPGGIWTALDGLIRAVPALDTLDPVTSELIRLRGARQHDCRLCRSLRSRSALLAGATDATFDAVDHHADSQLSPLQRAALAFTDAMIWTPGHLDPPAVERLRAEADAAQQVEVVLDVTRNALNKVAVALGADAAHVEYGIEIYDVGPDGELLYGLTLD